MEPKRLNNTGRVVNEYPDQEYQGPDIKGAAFGVGALIAIVFGVVILSIIFVWGSNVIHAQAGAIMTVIIWGAIFVPVLVLVGHQGAKHYRMVKEENRKDRRFKQNENGGYDALLNNNGDGFLQPVNGAVKQVCPQNMTYAPHSAYRNDERITGITEENQALLGPARGIDVKDIHIPTFREMLDSGEIGPGQQDLLLCHEVLRDEMTGAFTGELQPWHGGIESTSTNFLGGSSKSGKSTYMAHIAAQGALMNALFCVFDPHLAQADKSVARKLEALSRSFILPPAATNVQVRATLDFLMEEADARVNGRETRYSGRMINVLIDEALAFMARAQQTDNKEVQKLYRDLAFFMRALGTEYNKFGMNGVFASQFVTKDAFKLPGGGADFRDGCQSQTLLKLPPNQAQVMRLLDKKDLPGVRSLPPGHGYMGFAEGGEVIRMASGLVTRADIEYVAQLTQPSPDRKTQYSMPDLPMRPVSRNLRQETPGNTLETETETPVSTAWEATSNIIDGVFGNASDEFEDVSTKETKAPVETAIRETIRRMKEAHESDRKIARFVGLSGRKYGVYQQVCRELGFVAEKAEGE